MLSRLCTVKKRFPNWRNPFARQFSERHLEYFEYIMTFETSKVDLDVRYIYFPLQLQPEMTTSALGGIFMDQALALEQLSIILPEDVKIYVKENPKQQSSMRDHLFYHRLKRIKNLVMMPSYTSTHQLLDHALCVATITGTVGWEAICKGKPAITFGAAWYRSFPGVFQFHSALNFNDVLAFKNDHQQLEKLFGKFLSVAPKGIIYNTYKTICPDFDEKTNTQVIADYLADLIAGRVKPMFDA